MGVTAVGGRGGTGAGTAPGDAAEARLRETARQLQGVFVQQLFQAMRETVPQENALVSGGLGEDIFRGMFDEHVAGTVPASLDRPGGLTDAIVRQLRARQGGSSGPGAFMGTPAPAADAGGVWRAMPPADPLQSLDVPPTPVLPAPHREIP